MGNPLKLSTNLELIANRQVKNQFSNGSLGMTPAEFEAAPIDLKINSTFDIIQKIGAQVIKEAGPFTNPLAFFKRSDNKMNQYVEMLFSGLLRPMDVFAQGFDDGTTYDPWKIHKSDIVSQLFTSKFYKIIPLTIKNIMAKEAILAGNLESFIASCIRQLGFSKEVIEFAEAKKLISRYINDPTVVNSPHMTRTVTAITDPESAMAFLLEVLKVSNAMAHAKSLYNRSGATRIVPQMNQVLYVNSDVDAWLTIALAYKRSDYRLQTLADTLQRKVVLDDFSDVLPYTVPSTGDPVRVFPLFDSDGMHVKATADGTNYKKGDLLYTSTDGGSTIYDTTPVQLIDGNSKVQALLAEEDLFFITENNYSLKYTEHPIEPYTNFSLLSEGLFGSPSVCNGVVFKTA